MKILNEEARWAGKMTLLLRILPCVRKFDVLLMIFVRNKILPSRPDLNRDEDARRQPL